MADLSPSLPFPNMSPEWNRKYQEQQVAERNAHQNDPATMAYDQQQAAGGKINLAANQGLANRMTSFANGTLNPSADISTGVGTGANYGADANGNPLPIDPKLDPKTWKPTGVMGSPEWLKSLNEFNTSQSGPGLNSPSSGIKQPDFPTGGIGPSPNIVNNQLSTPSSIPNNSTVNKPGSLTNSMGTNQTLSNSLGTSPSSSMTSSMMTQPMNKPMMTGPSNQPSFGSKLRQNRGIM